MKILNSKKPDFKERLERILKSDNIINPEINDTVNQIIKRVAQDGDDALIELAKELDAARISLETLKVCQEEIDDAYRQIDLEQVEHLREAASRITAFHREQKRSSWFISEEPGIMLGQLIRPIQRAGVYVPGGKANYPSSVLMNVIPAKVAGVEEIIICSPPRKDGSIDPSILVAADITGVGNIYKAGGAQAIAAMAHGTQIVPKVDKIVGPGNIYVTVAKKQLFGLVGIDMLAGPSEILIIADDSAKADYIAADLLSQAEHDELSRSILITASRQLAYQVEQALDKQLKALDRRDIAKRAIGDNGAIILVTDLDMAFELANLIAPEHLELAIDDPVALLHKVKNAGAVFLGHYTPEALGDYVAGPNHVLPTAGCARFSSPLGVYDFIKRTSVVYYNKQALKKHGETAISLANLERLNAHAAAVKVRLKD